MNESALSHPPTLVSDMKSSKIFKKPKCQNPILSNVVQSEIRHLKHRAKHGVIKAAQSHHSKIFNIVFAFLLLHEAACMLSLCLCITSGLECVSKGGDRAQGLILIPGACKS